MRGSFPSYSHAVVPTHPAMPASHAGLERQPWSALASVAHSRATQAASPDGHGPPAASTRDTHA